MIRYVGEMNDYDGVQAVIGRDRAGIEASVTGHVRVPSEGDAVPVTAA